MAEPGGTHRALREATRPDHDRLDALFARADLSDPRGYAAFLRAHARALFAIEAALDRAGFERDLPDWPARRRTQSLAADLAVLDVPLPAPAPPPALDAAPARWGAAYVIEGSRLGGAVLARQVAPGLPTSYLGTRAAPGRWRAFLLALDNAVADPQERSLAVESARMTFALFETAGRDLLEPA